MIDPPGETRRVNRCRGCESFDWPLATEIAWMKGETQPAQSGDEIASPPEKAITFTLRPTAEVKFQVPPTGKPKGDPAETFGGLVTIANLPGAGLYQITLSGKGWIDAIQNGAALKTAAHTGKSDCDGVRKSVRFNLAAGPVVIQLSDVPQSSITLAVRRAE